VSALAALEALDLVPDRQFTKAGYVPESGFLPTQFPSRAETMLRQMPEMRLSLSILADALYQAFKKNSYEAAAALAWILETADADYVFSFPAICERLGIDPERLSQKVAARLAGAEWHLGTGWRRQLTGRTNREAISGHAAPAEAHQPGPRP